LKVLNLIKGKIRHENKINQINNNILARPFFKSLPKFILNTDNNLYNYWLAGFTDADGSFQIKVLKRIKRIEIRLNFQVDQKKEDLLILIKNFLGGNIGYRKSLDTYYYGSTSFVSAHEVVNYFDRYPLLSSKHLNYLKWKKAYLIIQEGGHLTKEGQTKIIQLKETMNSKSSEQVFLD
jgi:hypothetical protein